MVGARSFFRRQLKPPFFLQMSLFVKEHKVFKRIKECVSISKGENMLCILDERGEDYVIYFFI